MPVNHILGGLFLFVHSFDAEVQKNRLVSQKL